MSFAEYVFWGSLALTAYVYAAYPVLVWLLSRLFARAVPKIETYHARGTDSREKWPMISLVIAAYREEKVILERLKNAVLLDYPFADGDLIRDRCIALIVRGIAGVNDGVCHGEDLRR